jgi:hypothetical protein
MGKFDSCFHSRFLRKFIFEIKNEGEVLGKNFKKFSIYIFLKF